MSRISKNKEPILAEKPYIMAVKDFIKYTMNNSEFFNSPPEEQKDIAMEFIKKHKETYR